MFVSLGLDPLPIPDIRIPYSLDTVSVYQCVTVPKMLTDTDTFFPVPNIFGTDTGTFFGTNFF